MVLTEYGSSFLCSAAGNGQQKKPSSLEIYSLWDKSHRASAVPPILPILLKEPTTRRTLSCAFRNNGRMPSAPTGQRRLGCPHESIPQHPRRRNPTTCSSLCALHEAYFSRSTVYFIALTLPHCREFVKRGRISFFSRMTRGAACPEKAKSWRGIVTKISAHCYKNYT